MGCSAPFFRNPPVVETALSVQFDPLARMRAAHLGVFWHRHLRGTHPLLEEASEIEPPFE